MITGGICGCSPLYNRDEGESDRNSAGDCGMEWALCEEHADAMDDTPDDEQDSTEDAEERRGGGNSGPVAV